MHILAKHNRPHLCRFWKLQNWKERKKKKTPKQSASLSKCWGGPETWPPAAWTPEIFCEVAYRWPSPSFKVFILFLLRHPAPELTAVTFKEPFLPSPRSKNRYPILQMREHYFVLNNNAIPSFVWKTAFWFNASASCRIHLWRVSDMLCFQWATDMFTNIIVNKHVNKHDVYDLHLLHLIFQKL